VPFLFITSVESFRAYCQISAARGAHALVDSEINADASPVKQWGFGGNILELCFLIWFTKDFWDGSGAPQILDWPDAPAAKQRNRAVRAADSGSRAIGWEPVMVIPVPVFAARRFSFEVPAAVVDQLIPVARNAAVLNRRFNP